VTSWGGSPNDSAVARWTASSVPVLRLAILRDLALLDPGLRTRMRKIVERVEIGFPGFWLATLAGMGEPTKASKSVLPLRSRAACRGAGGSPGCYAPVFPGVLGAAVATALSGG
jgi:hypothetical protein